MKDYQTPYHRWKMILTVIPENAFVVCFKHNCSGETFFFFLPPNHCYSFFVLLLLLRLATIALQCNEFHRRYILDLQLYDL